MDPEEKEWMVEYWVKGAWHQLFDTEGCERPNWSQHQVVFMNHLICSIGGWRCNGIYIIRPACLSDDIPLVNFEEAACQAKEWEKANYLTEKDTILICRICNVRTRDTLPAGVL